MAPRRLLFHPLPAIDTADIEHVVAHAAVRIERWLARRELPPLCAICGGYNLHAGVHIPAHARPALERLCRYTLRPPQPKGRLEEGRESGSEGDALAIAYIEEAFSAYGLETPQGGYRQPFNDSNGVRSENVIGVLWGSDNLVSDEILVLMAHHDHIGIGSGGTLYRGANDNASGVAMLLTLADAFARTLPVPRRTLVFASFGAEEVNMDGSRAYVEDPPSDLPIADTVLGVNMDMVGTYSYDDVVYALDASAGTPSRAALEELLRDHPTLNVDMDYRGDTSDLDSFCAAAVPGVFLYTEDECYHSPCDVPNHLDYPNLAEIASLTADLVFTLAEGEHGLAAARARGCER